MNDEPEIVFNFWYLTDKTTGLVKSLLGRAYVMTGPDEEKLVLLRKLASTDWQLSKRYRVPTSTTVYASSGQTNHQGMIDPGVTNIPENMWLFEHILYELETEFPPKFVWQDGEMHEIPQEASKSPLLFCTCLEKNEYGNIEAKVGSRRYL